MNPICKQCGQREVEYARASYATPVCFACLLDLPPLHTAWSLPAEWLTDMAEALEHVRLEDGAPKPLTPALLLELVRDVLEDREHWKKRAEYALAPYLCPTCATSLAPHELVRIMCRRRVATGMAEKSAQFLELGSSVYVDDETYSASP